MREQSLLDGWEAALAAPPGWRPAALVGALEALPWTELAGWTVGRVNARLLALHAERFGHRIEGLSRCPGCGESIEIALPVADLLAIAPAATEGAWPVPTLGELWEAVQSPSDSVARASLLGRVAAAEQPAVEAAWAAADPLAGLELAVHCPACGQDWQEDFNAGAFVWRRVDAWAEGTLDEVSQLARAYGWPEADILALPASRRRRYLERAWA